MMIRSRRTALLLVLSAVAGQSGCHRLTATEVTAVPSRGTESALPPVAPPRAPKEFRRLTLAPLSGAAALIEGVTRDPRSVEPRKQLMELYRGAGYTGAAFFFENTIRVLEDRPLLTAGVQSDIGWSASDRDLTDQPRQLARSVAELMSQARYVEAIEKAQRDIQEHGSTLQVAVQWSHAVLREAVVEPREVTAGALEVAIRVFLTSLEEKVPMAVGVDSRAGGYAELAKAFARVGDSVSCRVAAKLALFHLHLKDDSPEWDTFAAERLRAMLQEGCDFGAGAN